MGKESIWYATNPSYSFPNDYNPKISIKTGQAVKYQHVLKKIELPLVPHAMCQNSLRKTRLGQAFRLHESFVCAGGEPGRDTCKVNWSSSFPQFQFILIEKCFFFFFFSFLILGWWRITISLPDTRWTQAIPLYASRHCRMGYWLRRKLCSRRLRIYSTCIFLDWR